MSQETVTFVDQFFQALDEHDEIRLLDLVHPNLEFTSLIQEVEGSFRGHEGLRSYLAGLFAAFPDWRVRVESVRAATNTAVVKVRVRATSVAGGVPTDLTDWQALTLCDGKALWWAFFRTETEALTAVGLEE